MVYYLFFNRHSFHVFFERLPCFLTFLVLGIVLLLIQCTIILIAKGSARGWLHAITFILFVFAYSALTLGFNGLLLESDIFSIPVEGKVLNCENADKIILVDGHDKEIATSPISSNKQYRFLLRPKDMERQGLKVFPQNFEGKFRPVMGRSSDLDISCLVDFHTAERGSGSG